MKKAVILLSGGLDSATCLGIAKSEGYECYALSFEYGQKHRAELESAKFLAKHFGVVQHEIISLDLGNTTRSAATCSDISIPDHTPHNTIPVTYVPARNTLFLSFALGWAEVLNAEAIFIGVSSVDYSGYPDCRPEYIKAYQTMANLATKCGVEGNPIMIKTPLLHLSKADTIKKGLSVGVDYSLTVSCYRATEDGLACGDCDSCYLRKKGFADGGYEDVTRYVSSL